MRDVLGVRNSFLGVGLLIVAAAVWYVTTVVNWWKADRIPPALGSVTVVGLADPQAKAMAAALPAIVLSELRRLGERTNQAKRQLQEVEQTQSRQTLVQDPRFEPVPVPETLKMEVAIPQQVAGVEIGWLLSWIKDALAPTNVIDLTAAYEADGKRRRCSATPRAEPATRSTFGTRPGVLTKCPGRRGRDHPARATARGNCRAAAASVCLHSGRRRAVGLCDIREGRAFARRSAQPPGFHAAIPVAARVARQDRRDLRAVGRTAMACCGNC